MPSLRSSLEALAESFADSVLDVVRSANMDELIGTQGARSARVVTTAPTAKLTRPTAKPAKPGRLPRRSAEDIAAALGHVVALVKKNKEGLRAEEIRANLGLESKELPRVLKEGIATKKLKTKGQKRATTYFAV
ncbi:MAG TPA: hypothetical protein VK841_00725 [Polyangiaceae bacterium]|jgi:hypothetical protein|nr:hypothetical protein [Polyangiaceae bacterium]